MGSTEATGAVRVSTAWHVDEEVESTQKYDDYYYLYAVIFDSRLAYVSISQTVQILQKRRWLSPGQPLHIVSSHYDI